MGGGAQAAVREAWLPWAPIATALVIRKKRFAYMAKLSKPLNYLIFKNNLIQW